ncbi:MFS transporter [Nocardia sp. NPDC058518]|uniref:MFS transporter n=1 Tax=Nocardia sp. NPDC058518 TaxID=3346534 RepID=UPI00365DDEFC
MTTTSAPEWSDPPLEAATTPPDPSDGPSTKRVVVAGMIGTVIEYFDFLVYATVAGLVFGDLFFPSDNSFIGTMLVWATFAVGFLVRPLGGIIFGHIGDRIGRSKILFISLTMMGVSTTLIGLMPTYHQIGIAAPIILVILRVVQGLGVGGEYGGATLMVIEHSHRSGRRGLYGALMSASASLGFLLASGLMAILTAVSSDSQFEGWVWRIPFLLSALLLIVGFYIRRRLGETPMMKEALEKHETVKTPLAELFRSNRRELAIALAVPFGLFAAYYIIMVFSIPFAVDQGVSNQSLLLAMVTIAQIIYLIAVVSGGALSDRFGRRLPMLAGAIGLGVWSFAFFPLLLSGSAAGVLTAFAVALLFLGLIYGPMGAFLAELFSTKVRLSGLSFGYQIGAAVAGGLSPLLATFLVHELGSWVPVAFVVSIALSFTFIAAAISRDRTNIDLTK